MSALLSLGDQAGIELLSLLGHGLLVLLLPVVVALASRRLVPILGATAFSLVAGATLIGGIGAAAGLIGTVIWLAGLIAALFSLRPGRDAKRVAALEHQVQELRRTLIELRAEYEREWLGRLHGTRVEPARGSVDVSQH